jgi:uncharacterized repeat protein (TIGR01451 family)
MHFGDTLSGMISAPDEQACYSVSGSAGDGVRVGVEGTSGTLIPVQEIRRPDGTVLCSGPSAVECTLDASGLHTIVVRDSNGTGTGGYTLSLTCVAGSCGAPVPHLNIGMTAALTSARFTRTLAYTITVSNDGGAPAPDVVVEDTLPQGLFVRSLNSSQGTCSHVRSAVTCTLGSLAPSGSAVVNITAVTVLSSGTVINTACVAPDNCATTVTDLSGPDAGPD